MSLESMLTEGLPLNRKERFFTGTVFPMIVCKDNLKHLHLFLSMLPGIEVPTIIADPAKTNVLFFTEYSLLESLVGAAKETFKELPGTKDTPDIVIWIKSSRNILITLEAKMYDTPTTDALNRQMQAQAKMLKSIKNTIGIDQIYHYALLPEKLLKQRQELCFPIITWEQLLKQYKPICDGDYFYNMLRIALERYDDLVSAGPLYGINCEEKISGQQIYELFKQGVLDKSSMGRNKGINGELLRNDIATRKWQSFKYETSSKRPSELNKNWFLIEDFINLIDRQQGSQFAT
jgi:hypothetical protein